MKNQNDETREHFKELNKRKLGALWVKTGKEGKKFLSGVLEIKGEKTPIVVFKNGSKKDSNNFPDWEIFRVSDNNNNNDGNDILDDNYE